MLDYVGRVYQLCATRFPLAQTYPVHVRIGFYRANYQRQNDGTALLYEDGISFPVPSLLERQPSLHVINDGASGEPMIVPLRIVPPEPSPPPELSFRALLARRRRSPDPQTRWQLLAREIRERLFYNCLNRYLREKHVEAEVKAGPEISEAFTVPDYAGFLRRYSFAKLLPLTMYAVVAVVLTIFSPFLLFGTLPSIFFGRRIYRKVKRMQTALREGRGGEYLLARIHEAELTPPNLLQVLMGRGSSD